jgi:7-cyano-7-deazaguanine reductase
MTEEMPLGREVPYPEQYSPELLYAVPRAAQRARLGLGSRLPFHGTDIWNAWELTWLAPNGMPRYATAEVRVPFDSPNIIESKSLKLYLNSFAMSRYASAEDVAETVEADLSDCTGADVSVNLRRASSTGGSRIARLPGFCLDSLQVDCDADTVDPSLLRCESGEAVSEDLYTHLLRSLCPVTHQPDSGSVLVTYAGPRIDREGLLRYIVSFRRHEDFHESCVERMFVDILEQCSPERLTVYARYQRRGGIDINPFRSNFEDDVPNTRLWRQ